MITLGHLKRMAQGQGDTRPVSLAALSQHLGYDRRTLDQRLRRGGPELTDAEQQRLRDLFWILGLAVREDLPGLPLNGRP